MEKILGAINKIMASLKRFVEQMMKHWKHLQEEMRRAKIKKTVNYSISEARLDASKIHYILSRRKIYNENE